MLYIENRREVVLSLSIRGVEGDSPFYSCSQFVHDFYRSLLSEFPRGVSAASSMATLSLHLGGGKVLAP